LLDTVPEEDRAIMDIISKYYEHVWDVAHAPYYRHGCGMFAKLLEVPSSSCINQRSVTDEGM
jgi:hypothetical protein